MFKKTHPMKWAGAALATVTLTALAAPMSALADTSSTSSTSAGTTTTNVLGNPSTSQGTITLSQTVAKVGTTIHVSASGLQPNATMSVVWETFKGSWDVNGTSFIGESYTTGKQTIGTVTTNAEGQVSYTFKVPSGYGDIHQLGLVDGNGLVDAEASITVQATCTVSKVSVPEGNFFDVHMDGLGYGAYTAEYEVLYDNHLTGYISGVTTNGSADVKVRAEGSGKHLLQVLGGGVDPVPYLNWQQSPYQWVPNFTFDVNVTKGNPKTVADGLPRLQASVGDKLTANPGLGHVGDTFTLGGTGLTPNKTYAVAWMTEDGNHVTAAGYHDGSISMGTVTTSSTGTFSVKLKAPDDLGGPAHTIQLLDGQTVVGSTTYRIYPSLFSAPKQVKQGQLFTVHLKGTGYTYFDNIYSVDYDNSWIGYGCGFNSHGDLQFQIHATGAPGIHYVDIYPTVYKGNQALPNPYVVPQLSYAADHPGDDLPAFHIAFTVTK